MEMLRHPMACATRLRIRAYISPIGAFVRQTGVSRHAVEMLGQLGQRSDEIDLSLLVNPTAYSAVERDLPSALQAVRKDRLRGPEAVMRRLLVGTRLVRADSGLGSADWVYCPNLQPVYCGQAKLAVTIHDTVAFEDPSRLREQMSRRALIARRSLMSRCLHRADLICVVSNYSKNRILELFPETQDHRMAVVGNAVAEVFFDARKAEQRTQEVLEQFALQSQQYVLACGPLLYRKGADVLLALAAHLKKQASGVVLAVAGSRHDPEFVKQAEGLRSHFRMLDYVPADRLAVLMRSALVLALPSRCESFGIPAVEAMAAGTPVICSTADALPEIVGDAGLFADSAEELIGQIERVSASPSLRQQLIERGRLRAAQFTWERCANRLVDAMHAVEAASQPALPPSKG